MKAPPSAPHVAFFLALGLEPLVRWATARRVPRWASVTAVFVVGGAALLLLFIGIHNAWDTVTYHVFVRRRERRDSDPHG